MRRRVRSARGRWGELGPEGVVEGAQLDGKGLPWDGEAALFRRAHQLGRREEVMEGGNHGQVVRREIGIGAHLRGVGSFQGGAEEDVVKGTREALRAHPRGGLGKGV